MKHVLPPCGDAAAERRRILFQTKGISWHGASMSRADCDVRQERNTYRHILTSDFVYPSPAHPMLTHPEKPQAADIDNSINFGVRGQGGTAHTLSRVLVCPRYLKLRYVGWCSSCQRMCAMPHAKCCEWMISACSVAPRCLAGSVETGEISLETILKTVKSH